MSRVLISADIELSAAFVTWLEFKVDSFPLNMLSPHRNRGVWIGLNSQLLYQSFVIFHQTCILIGWLLKQTAPGIVISCSIMIFMFCSTFNLWHVDSFIETCKIFCLNMKIIMIFSSLFCLSKILYYKTHMLSDISSPLMSIQHYQVCKSVASTLLDDSKFYKAYILY